MRKIEGTAERFKDKQASRDMLLLSTMGREGVFLAHETTRLGQVASIIAFRAFAHIAGEPPTSRRESTLEPLTLASLELDDHDIESSVEMLDYLDDEELEALEREKQFQADFLATEGPPPIPGSPAEKAFEGRERGELQGRLDLQELLQALSGATGGVATLEDCSLCDAVDCPDRKAPYDPYRKAVAGKREDN